MYSTRRVQLFFGGRERIISAVFPLHFRPYILHSKRILLNGYTFRTYQTNFACAVVAAQIINVANCQVDIRHTANLQSACLVTIKFRRSDHYRSSRTSVIALLLKFLNSLPSSYVINLRKRERAIIKFINC